MDFVGFSSMVIYVAFLYTQGIILAALGFEILEYQLVVEYNQPTIQPCNFTN